MLQNRQKFVIASLLLSLGGMLFADDEVVSLDKVPAAVLNAVERRFPIPNIKQAKKGMEGRTIYYEIELLVKEKQVDVVLTPEGRITEIYREIDEADLPKAVAKSLAEKYPKATIEDVTAVYEVIKGRETLTHFEIEIMTAEESVWEIEISPGGRVRKEKKKDL